MTESLTSRSALRDPGAATRRWIVVATLLMALLGAMSVIATAWAPPSGASPRPTPTSEPAPPTSATDPTDAIAPNGDAPASTAPPLVEQRPLPGETTPTEPVEKGNALNNALPRPNSGHEPFYQGDRGTGSQYAVLGAMLLALGVIVGLVVRQSRRSTRRWSAAAPMAGSSEHTADADGPAPEGTQGQGSDSEGSGAS